MAAMIHFLIDILSANTEFFYSSFPPFSNVLYPVHSFNLTHLSLRKWKCPICRPPTVPGSPHLQPKLPTFPLANVE